MQKIQAKNRSNIQIISRGFSLFARYVCLVKWHIKIHAKILNSKTEKRGEMKWHKLLRYLPTDIFILN